MKLLDALPRLKKVAENAKRHRWAEDAFIYVKVGSDFGTCAKEAAITCGSSLPALVRAVEIAHETLVKIGNGIGTRSRDGLGPNRAAIEALRLIAGIEIEEIA